MTTVDIGFVGDVMFGRNVDWYQRRRSPEAVWGDVLPRLQALDGLVVNLECVLSTRGSEWTRTYRPFHFRADPDWATDALEHAGVDCCALANNHVLDYGDVALADTLDALDEAGIVHAGAGRTLEAALAPATFTASDLRVTTLAMTDNTPEYAADGGTSGTVYVELDEGAETGLDADSHPVVDRALAAARRTDPDLLVASLHLGPNMVDRPDRTQERFARWLATEGVDVVHGHSAHAFHGVEVSEGSVLVHDAGDFVDDYRVDARLRNDRSFLFVLSVADGSPRELRLHPVYIDDCAVNEAAGETARWCRETMRDRSEPYGTPFVQEDGALVVRLD